MSETTDREMWRTWQRQVMSMPGVVAVGESVHQGRPCAKVYFADEVASEQTKLPTAPSGWEVLRQVSGAIPLQDSPDGDRDPSSEGPRHRPPS